MMFPRALLGLLSATVVAAAGLMLTPAASHAEPPLHHVKYTVFSEQPFFVEIYYRDVDPPNWAEYSHNPYRFSPNVEADVGPDQMWVQDVMLADPERWAMVTASTGGSTGTPNIHCVLAVDGVVVKTHQGPKGALCSLRNW
jgi:hypothetical protein